MYSKEIKEDDSFKKAQELADVFATEDGRRPRILMANMPENAQDHGTKVVAAGFADVGFDVDIGPISQSPKETAKQAVENDVHILSISSHAGAHKTIVPQIVAALKAFGREDIMIIVRGDIPKQDYPFLLDAGVSYVFNHDAKINATAIEILEQLLS